MFTARRRVVGLTIAYMALALVGFLVAPQSAIPQFYTSFLPLAFVAGCWIGLAQLEGKIATLPGPAMLGLALVVVIGLIEGFVWNRGLVEDATAFVGFLAFSAGVVLLALRYQQSLPQLTWLERLGNASYSIYLAHIFAVALIAGLGLRLIGSSLPGIVPIVTVVAIATGIWIGLMLYRYVERPMLSRMQRQPG
jgi:peptidoglycan/LPS O-acetylase OafA/YrhL